MELIKHNNFIFEYKKFVDAETCDEIIYSIENSDFHKNNTKEENKIRNNYCLNLTQLSHFDESIKKTDLLIHQKISQCHLNYISDNKFLYFVNRLGYYNNLNCEYIYRYYNEDDYYEWHIDSSQTSNFIFSYVIYLNDDFVGGDTLFLLENLKISPSKGSILCFPCDFQTIHKSTKIKKGEKKIIWTCMEKRYI